MTRYRTIIRTILLSSLLGCTGIRDAAAAAPPAYRVTDLGTLGGSGSGAAGINASGQVTGYAYLAGDRTYHAFLWTPSSPNGTSGTMHDLGTLGGTSSAGTGINDSGQVAGSSSISTTVNVTHAFLYNGTMHDLGTLGGTASYGYGINASGQVTGDSHPTGDGAVHAFLYDGTMHDLGTLGGTSSTGSGINDSGQVTGFSNTTNPAIGHAFLYDGAMHDLETPGGLDSSGSGINASGQVTGAFLTTGDFEVRAFLWTPTESNGVSGATQDLGTLGGTYSVGRGINANGEVTGDADTTGNVARHAFLYTSGSGMVDLNTLIDPLSGWELTYASAINDAGQITGYGSIGGLTHAFLLTPVPEPASIALLALGVPFFIWRKSRRLVHPLERKIL